ncbi:Kinesin-like protein kif3a [Podochytrium sp. JEL0797]|nr:Kinesin-like protein kif3a [Podochytrium sp. JEL0797]
MVSPERECITTQHFPNKPLAQSEKEAVKVIVRCRPFSEKEKSGGHSCIVEINKELATVLIHDPRTGAGADPPKTFTFDSVFDWNSKQMDVYNRTARPIVESVLNGYNGTVFAYGQTGTGIRDTPELRGIIPNAFEHIFSHISLSSASTQYLVRASYLEIYNEDILDLLNPKAGKLELKERADVGVYVKDLRTFVIKDVEEMDRLMTFGNKNRSVGATEMNATSSRSHSIFSITVEASDKVETKSGKAASGGGEEDGRIRAGKLHLVDLAGSERQSKTGATGDRLKEATKINLSLSALGNVISALVDGKSSHIPYRDSKLTRLLQDSLGGNAKTLMIATLSPASYNYDETVSTLRYANRAKNIKNKPKINEDPKDAMLREFQEEIKRLKQQLEAAEHGGDMVEGPDGQKRHVIEEVEEIEEIEEVEETEDEDEEEGAGKGSERSKSTRSKRSKKSGKRKDTAGGEGARVLHNGISEERLAEMAKEVEREKMAIMETKDMEETEKNKLLDEVEERARELEEEREARHAVANKLAQLEQKLLVGGVSLLDKEAQIQLEMAQRAAELEEQKRKERELQRELEDHEETNLQIEEEYASLAEEKEAKTRKIKKLWNMLVQNRSEIKDLQEEHQREREDFLDTIRELTRELKLKMLTIHSFVPDEALAMLEDNAEYDEAAEKWKLLHVSHAGNNIRGKRSLVSGQVMGGGLHREHDYDVHDDSEDENNKWDPLCMFPDAYLSYDALLGSEVKKKRNVTTGSESKKSATKSTAIPQSGRKARPESAGPGSKRSPTRAGKAATRGDGTEGADEKDKVAPSARGLVSKGRRYA